MTDHGVPTLYWGTLLATMVTFALSSSSITNLVPCAGILECLSAENTSSSNVSLVCCRGFCVENLACDELNPKNSTITNNTRTNDRDNTTNTAVVIISRNGTKANRSRDHTSNISLLNTTVLVCRTSKDCGSSMFCLSLSCAGNTPSAKTFEKCSCVDLECQDGKCYKQLPAFTPLQYMLLFGTMGGIIVVIVIIFFVKTFTDRRRRRYLLKYGVWPEPEKDKEKENGESQPRDGGTSKKLEVPTITVETPVASVQNDRKHKPDVEPDAEEIKPNTTEERDNQKGAHVAENVKNAKGDTEQNKSPPEPGGKTTDSPIANSTFMPIENETIKPDNKGSPILRNRDFRVPDSPKQRFNVYRKGKDSPKRILANGSPEKMGSLGKKGSPPAQLVEPENFSDYGM